MVLKLQRRFDMLRMLPRLAILATAIGELLAGDIQYGVFCLVALAITLIPAIHARRLDAGIPLALELGLLWLMVADMTLGNWLGLYTLTWYDKAIHFSSSLLVGMIGFLAIYVFHLVNEPRVQPWVMAVGIFLVVLGVGALWEIAEYAVDHLFGRSTQGSPNMDALDDTMVDLMLDAAGAVIAAFLGTRYILRRSASRMAASRNVSSLSAPSAFASTATARS